MDDRNVLAGWLNQKVSQPVKPKTGECIWEYDVCPHISFWIKDGTSCISAVFMCEECGAVEKKIASRKQE